MTPSLFYTQLLPFLALFAVYAVGAGVCAVITHKLRRMRGAQ